MYSCEVQYFTINPLTLLWRRPLAYRNQSIDLRSKSMDWFLYNNGLRHDRVNSVGIVTIECISDHNNIDNKRNICRNDKLNLKKR